MKKRYVIIFLVFILSIYVFKNFFKDSFLKVDNSITNINRQLVNVKSSIYETSSNIFNVLNYASNKAEENEKIEKLNLKIKELESKIENFKEIEDENRKLKDILNLKLNYNENIVSKVILTDNIIGADTIYIDKGTSSGILVGMPVLYKKYLIGIVEYTTDDFSEVKLITNKDVKISVLINNNVLAVIRGNGNNTFSINKYNGEIEDIKSQVFNIETSGISTLFKKGIKIGSYKNINEKEYEKIHKLEFIPNYRVEDLDYVVVYKKGININKINKIEGK